jgi:hypothetical protein
MTLSGNMFGVSGPAPLSCRRLQHRRQHREVVFAFAGGGPSCSTGAGGHDLRGAPLCIKTAIVPRTTWASLVSVSTATSAKRPVRGSLRGPRAGKLGLLSRSPAAVGRCLLHTGGYALRATRCFWACSMPRLQGGRLLLARPAGSWCSVPEVAFIVTQPTAFYPGGH